MRINHWSAEDPSNQLRPELNRERFQSLTGWDFGWLLFEPLRGAKNDQEEIELSKQLSRGQKALYFFWYLDGQVTNGGFIQFYWNGYDKYLPAINEGLKLIEDHEMMAVIQNAEREFLLNIDAFVRQRQVDDWEPLYDNLKNFEEYDTKFYELHDKTMSLIEKYARQNPTEFGIVV